jgi:phosphoglucomutase
MDKRAGLPAHPADLIDVQAVLDAYHSIIPHPDNPSERVSFGTSGHRGRSLAGSFNDAHIRSITQAIVDYRTAQGITGPIYVAADTHLLSAPATATVLEVLAGNKVVALVDSESRPTPTPAVSHAIIRHNRHESAQADGIILTPSHNPPADGGIKYNPPHGGPADDTITAVIARSANDYLSRPSDIPRATPEPKPFDFVGSYVSDLDRVIDMEACRRLTTRVAVHPLGGASVHYWQAIADHWSIPLDIVDDTVDPQFGFMTLDHDGIIRMDPSSPSVMAVTDEAGRDYPLLIANDADADRHGIRCGDSGVMNPNHFLSVAIDYLLSHRPDWSASARVGKTMVSSSMIDRVVAHHNRTLHEVPVGFKWFVAGLTDGSLCFGGEESAGAVCVAQDGSLFVTEKDGIVLGLLAMEILATTGQTPDHHYRGLEATHGSTSYRRTDAPATEAITRYLATLSADDFSGELLAGDPIIDASTTAPTGGSFGGIKLVTPSGWIAARPSGTEPIYKIYAESFIGDDHLEKLVASAADLLSKRVAL